MSNFEKYYIALRDQEQRLYTDEQVQLLPEISLNHPHFKEWKLRKRSADKLTRYLTRKSKPLNILEVGCGNGWLSHQLSKVAGANVVGIDINGSELAQAARVFAKIPNLRFTDAKLEQLEASFDIIVFAASIQYFASLTHTLNTALALLKDDGEIHIIDTNFYGEDEIKGARQRSREHFRAMGSDEMNQFYFHHSLQELQSFRADILFNPRSWKNRWVVNKHPFYWVSIKRMFSL